MPKLPENVVMVTVEVPVYVGEMHASRRISLEGRLADDAAVGCERVLRAHQLIDQQARSSHVPNNSITRIRSVQHILNQIGDAAKSLQVS